MALIYPGTSEVPARGQTNWLVFWLVFGTLLTLVVAAIAWIIYSSFRDRHKYDTPLLSRRQSKLFQRRVLRFVWHHSMNDMLPLFPVITPGQVEKLLSMPPDQIETEIDRMLRDISENGQQEDKGDATTSESSESSDERGQ